MCFFSMVFCLIVLKKARRICFFFPMFSNGPLLNSVEEGWTNMFFYDVLFNGAEEERTNVFFILSCFVQWCFV